MSAENVNPVSLNAAPTPVTATRPRRREKRVDRVSWTAHAKTIFLWPVVAAGYLFWGFDSWGWLRPETLGWLYVLLVTMVVLAVTVDLSRNYAVFCVVCVLLIYFVGRWLQDVKGITVLGNLYRGFAAIDVQYHRQTGLALSILLSIVFVIGLAWAWLNHRYTITHNEIVHHVVGRGDISIGRGARVIRMLYPDAFEFALCLAGTIVVYDNTGRAQILKTEQVPWLYFKRRKIDKILESLEVTTDGSDTSDVGGGDHSGADDLH